LARITRLAKGALFLGTGAFAAQTGHAARLGVTLALLLPALVLAGVPASSGGLGKEALKAALANASPIWLPWLVVALTLSGMATTLLMARYMALLWLCPPKAPAQIAPEALLLPFLAVAGGALPLLWPVLAQELAAPIAQAAPGGIWPLAAGLGLAGAVALYAHARRIGPALFAARLTAPFRAFGARTDSLLAAKRRAARRLGHAVPKALSQTATDWRLGQTA
jgi:hypothetical protein